MTHPAPVQATPPQPFVDDSDFQLYVGDAIDVLRTLRDESVHCVVSSPPYWGLRSYLAEGHEDKPLELGAESTPEEYVVHMVEVFREVRRVLRKDGCCFLNLGDSYASAWACDRRNVVGAGSLENGKREDRPNRLVGGLKEKDLVGIPWRVAFALQQPYYTGRIKDERDRIWLAAMVEAEGCMFIHKRKAGQPNGQGYERKNDSFGAGLEVSSTDRVIVERCMAIAGIGSICEQTPEQNERRNCRIFLWATNLYLPESFSVLTAWGFTYKQTLVWHKTGNPSPFGGSLAPNHAEFLLVADRGSPKLLGRLTGSVIPAPKPYEHSKKPETFLDLIEFASPAPYLEMFSRRARLGWDTWGDEALHGTGATA